jgi:hypothetical protein
MAGNGFGIAAGAALGLVAMAGTAAQAEGPSVAARLEASGTKYTVDADGDYKILYNYTKEGRTQVVFVAGKIETVKGLAVREIFAPAALVDKHNIEGTQALDLLRKSARVKLGSWEIRGNIVYFVIKIYDGASAAELDAALDVAAETADNMEIELTNGSDDL